MRTDETKPDYYSEGRSDFLASMLCRGGTHGPAWNADVRNLIGEDRDEYIAGWESQEEQEQNENDETE